MSDRMDQCGRTDDVRARRRGVAVLMAIAMIGLTAAILVSVAARATVESRRGGLARDDAQAGQLLAAAVAVAQGQLHAGRPADGVVETPVGRVTLVWDGAGDMRHCTIGVAAGVARRAATCRFAGETLKNLE